MGASVGLVDLEFLEDGELTNDKKETRPNTGRNSAIVPRSAANMGPARTMETIRKTTTKALDRAICSRR